MTDGPPGERGFPRAAVFAVLAVAVLAISTAPILVKGIGSDASPLAIAFWRTTIVAAMLSPTIRPVRRHDLLWIGLAGACLGLHFTTWFASFQTTSVMRSTVLVCTGPIWVGLLEWGLLRRPPAPRYWLGMAVAVGGIALMVVGDESRPGSLTGDGLALLGAFFVAIYMLIGRHVRQRVPIGSYAAMVCAAAAISLLPVLLLTGTAFHGWSGAVWLLIVALAAGPQMLGHNGFNFALRYLPASVVSAATLLEPVGATLLAIPIFGETPSLSGGAGGLISVVGVVLATVSRR